MNTPEFYTLLFAIITGTGFIYRELKSFQKDIQEDIRNQASRSDKLYEMFIEHRKEIDQKFYDLLKERK